MATSLENAGLAYPDASVQTTAGFAHPVSIGSSFEGGFYVGSYYHLGYPYYLVVSPLSVQTQAKFRSVSSPGVPGGANLSPIDGYKNTYTYWTSDANSPAAQYCADLVHSGYSDWYLPSTMELLLAVYNKVALGDFQKLFGNKFYQGTSTPFYGWQYYCTSSSAKINAPSVIYSPDGFINYSSAFGSDSYFTTTFFYVRPFRRVAI